MYTDHTSNQLVRVALSLAGILIATAPTFAQTRLSSNPNDLRDAFAKHPAQASTPQAFADFVAKNATLSQRYARHFNVPQDNVVSFFKTSLVPLTLSEKRMITTYGVTDSGAIYPVKTTLPRGGQVWATREGVPVIKWNCSNPLTTMLPGATLATRPSEFASTPSPIMPTVYTPGVGVPDSLGFATSSSISDDGMQSGDALAVAPPLPATDASSFAFGVPSVSTTSSDALPGLGEIVDAGASSIGIDDLLPALLLVPAILAATGNGSDTVFTAESEPLMTVGSGETLPFVPGGTAESLPLQPVVVPESSTMGLIVAGLPLCIATFALTRRRKLV